MLVPVVRAFVTSLKALEDVERPVDRVGQLPTPVLTLVAIPLVLLLATDPRHQIEEELILIACKLVLKDFVKGSYARILGHMHPSANRKVKC